MRSNLAAGKHFVVACLCLIAYLLMPSLCSAAEDVRIEVNTSELSLTVWSGNKALRHFRHISLGSGGVSDVHYQGDETTPIGEYTVLWINRDSPFDNFVGLNYPNRQHAEIALRDGKLTLQEYERIVWAARHQQRPPFNTALGGRIGIHGIGLGDKRIHEAVNWTNGCVALTNEEMRELMQWIRIGTKVSIRR
jgi:murein L,D-transpeptidase YafK